MTKSSEVPDGFLSRWSRRKAKVRQGELAPEPVPPAPVRADASAGSAQGTSLREESKPSEGNPSPSIPQGERGAPSVRPTTDTRPAPTIDDVARLDRNSDFRRFVASDVAPDVKNAAMRKLFTDPHFNVMDGLDTYIDDYGKPDPIPAAMLRQMVQSQALGLFADEAEKPTPVPVARATPDGVAAADAAQSLSNPPQLNADDQNAAVRLQPLDAAGPPSDPGGAGQDAGRER